VYQSILESLEIYGVKIIAMFGAINPYLGAGATAVFAILIAWYSVKAKKEKKDNQNNNSDEKIGSQTGKDQRTVGNVEDKLDDFLK